jgi:hypothetical protein
MKTIETIYKAISKINPDAQSSMSGNDISALDTITFGKTAHHQFLLQIFKL